MSGALSGSVALRLSTWNSPSPLPQGPCTSYVPLCSSDGEVLCLEDRAMAQGHCCCPPLCHQTMGGLGTPAGWGRHRVLCPRQGPSLDNRLSFWGGDRPKTEISTNHQLSKNCMGENCTIPEDSGGHHRRQSGHLRCRLRRDLEPGGKNVPDTGNNSYRGLGEWENLVGQGGMWLSGGAPALQVFGPEFDALRGTEKDTERGNLE